MTHEVLAPSVHRAFFFGWLWPRTLWSRALTILLVALVLIQGVSWISFFKRHWEPMVFHQTRHLAERVRAGYHLFQTLQLPLDDKLARVQTFTDLRVTIEDTAPALPRYPYVFQRHLSRALKETMQERHWLKVRRDTTSVWLRSGGQFLRFDCLTKVWLTPTSFSWLLWSWGGSFVLAVVALFFLRAQLSPLRALAKMARRLEAGETLPPYKPRGATEMHQIGRTLHGAYARLLEQHEEQKEIWLGISHDLRTQLTRMRLRLSLANLQEEVVKDLIEDVQRMTTMCEAYEHFVQEGAPVAPRRTEVLAVVMRVMKRLEKRSGVKVNLSIPRGLFLTLDEEAFERCLDNLFANAMAYTHHRILFRLEVADTQATFCVMDDGPGVSADQFQRIFKPFVRLETHRQLRGCEAGLGLAIVKNLVKRMGGTVSASASSEQDDTFASGLTVTIVLPRECASADTLQHQGAAKAC